MKLHRSFLITISFQSAIVCNNKVFQFNRNKSAFEFLLFITHFHSKLRFHSYKQSCIKLFLPLTHFSLWLCALHIKKTFSIKKVLLIVQNDIWVDWSSISVYFMSQNIVANAYCYLNWFNLKEFLRFFFIKIDLFGTIVEPTYTYVLLVCCSTSLQYVQK